MKVAIGWLLCAIVIVSGCEGDNGATLIGYAGDDAGAADIGLAPDGGVDGGAEAMPQTHDTGAGGVIGAAGAGGSGGVGGSAMGGAGGAGGVGGVSGMPMGGSGGMGGVMGTGGMGGAMTMGGMGGTAAPPSCQLEMGKALAHLSCGAPSNGGVPRTFGRNGVVCSRCANIVAPGCLTTGNQSSQPMYCTKGSCDAECCVVDGFACESSSDCCSGVCAQGKCR